MSSPQSLFSVKDKVVLCSGGGRGIGLMIAAGYVAAGAQVIISSRDLKALNAAAEKLNKQGPGSCTVIKADLQKSSDIDELVKQVEAKHGKLDILINNSGATWGADYDSYPSTAWDKILTLNLTRVFELTQKLTPLLLKSVEARNQTNQPPFSDPARVINIGSIDGIRITNVEHYAYSASKAAVHQMTKVLANRLGPQGITVNALACGPFESKMMKATLDHAREAILADVPLGRIGEPDDVAGACIYLSSKAGSYINGVILPIDGGILVQAKL